MLSLKQYNEVKRVIDCRDDECIMQSLAVFHQMSPPTLVLSRIYHSDLKKMHLTNKDQRTGAKPWGTEISRRADDWGTRTIVIFSRWSWVHPENKPWNLHLNCKRDGLHGLHYRKYPKRHRKGMNGSMCRGTPGSRLLSFVFCTSDINMKRHWISFIRPVKFLW